MYEFISKKDKRTRFCLVPIYWIVTSFKSPCEPGGWRRITYPGRLGQKYETLSENKPKAKGLGVAQVGQNLPSSILTPYDVTGIANLQLKNKQRCTFLPVTWQEKPKAQYSVRRHPLSGWHQCCQFWTCPNLSVSASLTCAVGAPLLHPASRLAPFPVKKPELRAGSNLAPNGGVESDHRHCALNHPVFNLWGSLGASLKENLRSREASLSLLTAHHTAL
jgi:hypothetical protein